MTDPTLYTATDLDRFILENIPAVVFYIRIDAGQATTSTQFVSGYVSSIAGYEPEEFTRTEELWVNNIHPDDLATFRETTQRLKDSRSPGVRTYRIRHGRTGEYIWIEERVSGLFKADGHITGMVGIAHELTVMEKPGDASSRILTTQILNLIPDAFLLVDQAGRIKRINSEAEKLFGYAAGELIDKPVEVLIPESARADHLNHRIEFLRRPELRQMNSRPAISALNKHGTVFQVEASLAPLLLEGSNLVLVTIRDVSPRQLAKNERSRQLQVLEVMLNEVYMFDPQSLHFTYVNRGARENLGYKMTELRQMTPVDLKPEFSLESFSKLLLPLIQHETGRLVFTTEHQRKDGTVYPVEVYLQLIETGEESYYAAIINDISQRKIVEEQIRQAQKLDSLGTLASGMAHDFNNILGVILGHAELLKSGISDPARFATALDAILRSASRGAGIVNQLLTFARKNERKLESISINQSVMEIETLLRETFPKVISFSIQLQESLPVIAADPTQIHQVLLNLCVNARDAMPRGGTLVLQTRLISGLALHKLAHGQQRSFAENYVQIKVEDSGCGIDRHTRERIFEPFFTTKDIGKGSGMGLSSVLGIVQSHEGFVTVDSEPGVGTIFCVYLPASDLGSTPATAPGPAQPEYLTGTETVLLIEDEEFLCRMVQNQLVDNGYTVLTARDGQAGIQMYTANQQAIDLVITDLGLPLVGGDEVVQRIRNASSDVKIIVTSGFLDSGLKASLEKLGVQKFLHKPYMIGQILVAVRQTLDSGNPK